MTAKQYGPRYGRRIRKQVHLVEKLYKGKSYKCPKCNKLKVKRLAAGIWQCSSCKAKFASKAYEFVK